MSRMTRYRIAELEVEAELPAGVDASLVLPTAEPFRIATTDHEPALRFTTMGFTEAVASLTEEPRFRSEEQNDMGRVRLYTWGDKHLIEVSYREAFCHRMVIDGTLRHATAEMQWEDPTCKESLGSLLRIAYSMAILPHAGVSIHASAIHYNGEAILFLGKSGTGKSTHARLWLQHAAGATLLNDDNPMLRVQGTKLMAYGSPWSGKGACYRNEGYPVRGIVRLSQATENRFRELHDEEAFIALLPSCSVVRHDEGMEDMSLDLLGEILERVVVAHLACRPDKEAYIACHEGLYPTVKDEL